MRKYWCLLAVVAIASLAVWSCGQSPEEKPKPAGQAKAPVAAPAPAPAPAPKADTGPVAAPSPAPEPGPVAGAPTQAPPPPGMPPVPPGKGVPGGFPMGPGLYDPKTVTTVKGTVESLGMATGMGRRERASISVNLKTDQGVLPVHLAPIWYLHMQRVATSPGTVMEVTGSKVSPEGKTFIIAREIKVDGRVVPLRDEQGLPSWRPGHMPPMPKAEGPPKAIKVYEK